MKYTEVMEAIENSQPDEWGSCPGRTFNTIKYLLNNVDIRIESSLDEEDVQNDDYQDAWANGFPSKKAKGYFFNIYAGSTLLRRVILVSVDGARALLPPPRSLLDMTVDEFDYKVAAIHDSGLLDQYMGRAGLKIA